MSENDDRMINFYEHKDVKKLVPKYKPIIDHFNSRLSIIKMVNA